MLVQGTPVLPPLVQRDDETGERIGTTQSTQVVHSIKGYLAYCQDQLPDLELQSGGWMNGDARFPAMASLWKQNTQTMRCFYDDNAAKNEPHRGEPGQGGAGMHPRLTPYETEGLLQALLSNNLDDWNMEEDDEE